MVTINFGVPWMRQPERLIQLVDSLKSGQSNRKIDYTYFRPADLEFGKSVDVLRELAKSNIGLYLTTSARSGVDSIQKTLESLLSEGVLPDKLIVDRHSLKNVAENKIVNEYDISLYASAIMGIKGNNYEKLIQLKKTHPNIDAVCLHHDAIFDRNLKNYTKLLREEGIEPILLANESCFRGCPYREDHYEHVGLKHPNLPDNYQNLCLSVRNKNPATLKSISGFIHPDLLEKISEQTGITHFKITGMPSRGRGRTQEESERAILSYLGENKDSDLMNLACFTYLRDSSGKYRFSLDSQEFYDYQKKILNGEKPRTNNSGVEIHSGLTNQEEQSADFARFSHKINGIYRNNPILPWTGLTLPTEILRYLDDVLKDSSIHFSGCGLGELANELEEKGYESVSCSDISEVAIRKVREKYPSLESYVVPTQQLGFTDWRNKTVLDLHNLHQVNPASLEDYVSGISQIANKIIITWIYEPEKGISVNSDISELGKIYHHEPGVVKSLLQSKYNLKSEFSYDLENNSSFFPAENVRKNHMHGLYLEVKE